MTDAELTLLELEAFADVDEMRVELVRRMAKQLRIPEPRFKGWTASRGWAADGAYSLPRWAIEPRLHLLDYIAHEMAHVGRRHIGAKRHGYYDHGPELKRVERSLLRSFGVGVRFGRVYMRELTDRETGVVLFTSWREEARQAKAAGETPR